MCMIFSNMEMMKYLVEERKEEARIKYVWCIEACGKNNKDESIEILQENGCPLNKNGEDYFRHR